MDSAAERRTIGRVAGVAMLLAALAAFGTLHLLSAHAVPRAFDVVAALTICCGLGMILVPWDRLPAWSLHAIPVIAIALTAVGIRAAGVYDDITANYYLFVAVFAGYAFSSRLAIAAHVTLAAAASALPLLYQTPRGSETAARTVIGVLLLVVIAGLVTMLREGLQRRQRELEELVLRDPLTGVGNYRLFAERLDYEIARHQRSGGSLTVLLIDLDGFKEVNDTFGHLIGDKVLIEVARALADCVRSQDTLARQGGDEFSILAPETDDGQANRLASRVQGAVATATRGSLSTSVAWATYPTHAEDPAMLLALADTDLRRAKQECGTRAPGRAARPRAEILRLLEQPAS